MAEFNLHDEYAREVIDRARENGVVYTEQGLTVGEDGMGISRNYVCQRLQQAFKEVPGQQ
jgi:hypothetical protein